MAKLIQRWRYGSGDPVTPTKCALCCEGGLWTTKLGAPERKEVPDQNGECWEPKEQNGHCFTDEHKTVINPILLKHPIKLLEIFFHELFHAFDHAEKARGTKMWWIPHSVIYRLSKALAKWMNENNLEFVQRKREEDDVR